MAKTDFVNTFTPVGRLSYPKLFAPEFNKLKGKDLYETAILFPAGTNLKRLEGAIAEAARKMWPHPPPNLKTPLKSQSKLGKFDPNSGETQFPEGVEPEGFYLSVDSKFKPDIYTYPKKEIITDPEEIYGGVRARLSVSFFPYDYEGSRGVGVRLNAVQKMRDDERFGGGRRDTSEDFGALTDEEAAAL